MKRAEKVIVTADVSRALTIVRKHAWELHRLSNSFVSAGKRYLAGKVWWISRLFFHSVMEVKFQDKGRR